MSMFARVLQEQVVKTDGWLSRDELPQIDSDKVDEFLAWLRSKNVAVWPTPATARLLKPSQSELESDKVEALKKTPEKLTAGKIITSLDGFVLDGHHRWAAFCALYPEGSMPTWQVALPIAELLKLVEEFPGRVVKDIADKQVKESIVVRPEGWDAAVETVDGWKRAGHVYRGMEDEEYKATVAKGKAIKSIGRYSHPSEGTNFDDDPGGAESYVNFGRSDPRKTGKPNWMVEVKRVESMKRGSDGYWKSSDPVPVSDVTRIWRFSARSGAVVSDEVPVPHAVRESTASHIATRLDSSARRPDCELKGPGCVKRAWWKMNKPRPWGQFVCSTCLGTLEREHQRESLCAETDSGAIAGPPVPAFPRPGKRKNSIVVTKERKRVGEAVATEPTIGAIMKVARDEIKSAMHSKGFEVRLSGRDGETFSNPSKTLSGDTLVRNGEIRVSIGGAGLKAATRSAVSAMLLDVKRRVGEKLQHEFPERTFIHAKLHGEKVWWTYVDRYPDQLRTGIDVKLTDEERIRVNHGSRLERRNRVVTMPLTELRA